MNPVFKTLTLPVLAEIETLLAKADRHAFGRRA
jgi:hypothetical protein